MFRFLIYLITLATPFIAEATVYSYFSPPKGWEIATPDKDAAHVKLGFIGPNKSGFAPSLNLAVENVGDLSTNEYIKAVKEIHERIPQNRFRQLGKIRTLSGESSLTEIDSKTEWGDVRLMQMIFLKDKIAYIVTAAALKEEFGALTKDFQKAFQSFIVTDDLFISVSGEERQEMLKTSLNAVKKALTGTSLEDKTFQKEHWQPFEKTITSNFSDMGLFWQFLVFQEALK
ncbi:MAG: hypothetical protein V4494_06905 [Chlamydiota bacterium]